ncbi:hypothetical protein CCH79_00016239 [Gambusia affinis]|uniref:Uncharacterized protein n=1 Tax=Gambusia affinis TaxID=33528 RepID=A0A315VKZ1_GAMAF|nr:hypothetical protein CCH79_00016239 [Gambusia affinis]
MREHSHSMGASGPRRKRKASSASRLFPFDSRKRGVSGMKHMATISSDGGSEQQIASQRQSTNKPAGRGRRVGLLDETTSRFHELILHLKFKAELPDNDSAFRQTVSCLRDIRSALQLDPECQAARALQQHLMEASEENRQQAVLRLLSGQLQEALCLINAALESNPDNGQLYLFRLSRGCPPDWTLQLLFGKHEWHAAAGEDPILSELSCSCSPLPPNISIKAAKKPQINRHTATGQPAGRQITGRKSLTDQRNPLIIQKSSESSSSAVPARFPGVPVLLTGTTSEVMPLAMPVSTRPTYSIHTF